MTQWDTYEWDFPHGKHPCVVLSNPVICENPDIAQVNILGCSSRRAQRATRANESLLDEADGMDWETITRCDRIYLVEKASLKRRRGSVTLDRRREIGAKIIRCFGLRPY